MTQYGHQPDMFNDAQGDGFQAPDPETMVEKVAKRKAVETLIAEPKQRKTARRNQDIRQPRWITAKHGGRCVRCQGLIVKGDKIYFVPSVSESYGGRCGCAKLEAERREDVPAS